MCCRPEIQGLKDGGVVSSVVRRFLFLYIEFIHSYLLPAVSVYFAPLGDALNR